MAGPCYAACNYIGGGPLLRPRRRPTSHGPASGGRAPPSAPARALRATVDLLPAPVPRSAFVPRRVKTRIFFQFSRFLILRGLTKEKF